MVYLAIYLFLMRYVEDLCGLLIPVCTMDLVWLDFFCGVVFYVFLHLTIWQEYNSCSRPHKFSDQFFG